MMSEHDKEWMKRAACEWIDDMDAELCTLMREWDVEDDPTLMMRAMMDNGYKGLMRLRSVI